MACSRSSSSAVPEPGHEEAHVAHPLDQPGQGLERELEALLVDEPAHEQDEPLVGCGKARPQGVEVVHRHELGGVDPVRDHVHAALLEPVDVGHVLAHVRGAGDQAIRAIGHPALDAVDVGLRMLLDPALVAAVLRGMDRDHERRAEALREVVAGRGHKPVVAVDHVEVVAVPHLDARGEHVRVHVLDPGHELAQVARALRLADAVHEHPAHLLLGGILLAAAGEHVYVHALGRQVLRQLAHVPRESALDQWRVLPGQDQDAHLCSREWSRGRGRDVVPGRAATARGRSRSLSEPQAQRRGRRRAGSSARWGSPRPGRA